MNSSLFTTSPNLANKILAIHATGDVAIYGNTIIYGWLTSWTTWAIGGILLGLIIWNIVLSYKLKGFSKGRKSE